MLPLLTPSQSMEETLLFSYIFIDDHSEHPSTLFPASKKEVNVPFKDYFTGEETRCNDYS